MTPSTRRHSFIRPAFSAAHVRAPRTRGAPRAMALALAALAGSVSAGTLYVTTPGPGTWQVPPGVTQIRIVAVGAGGAAGSSADGAKITLDAYTVSPGATLAYAVGAKGGLGTMTSPTQRQASGYRGGDGGGGSTNLGLENVDPFVVAGGGGGAGVSSDSQPQPLMSGGSGCGAPAGGFGSSGSTAYGSGGGGGGNNVGGVAGAGVNTSYAWNVDAMAGTSGPGGSGARGGQPRTGQGYGELGGGGGPSVGNGIGGAGGYVYVAGGNPQAAVGGGGGGGGYGGGGGGGGGNGVVASGGGAGGSLWPGMTPTTSNSPTCVPSGDGWKDGWLKIEWVEPTPAPVPTLGEWALALLGLAAAGLGIRRLRRD